MIPVEDSRDSGSVVEFRPISEIEGICWIDIQSEELVVDHSNYSPFRKTITLETPDDVSQQYVEGRLTDEEMERALEIVLESCD